MSFYDGLRAVAAASGDGPIDWEAAATAAKAATDPGSLDLTPTEREGFATDVRDARRRVRSVTELQFDVPQTLEVQNRHHWIDANIATFSHVMAPLERQPIVLPELTRRVNTATMATMLSFLGNNVLGQYDPVLLADAGPRPGSIDSPESPRSGAPSDEHGLYFVRPNIRRVADELDVPYERFRRWITLHEVTHAAEFGAAPWLTAHLETHIEDTVSRLVAGEFDRASLRELNTTMTAVEGYAELIMDRAFDQQYRDLREKVEARRRNRGPLFELLGRVFGLGMKRRQYERGKAFFDAVADARGVTAAGAVWDHADNLPTDAEFDQPVRWLSRVDP